MLIYFFLIIYYLFLLNLTNTCKRGVFKHNATSNLQIVSGLCFHGIKILRVLIYGGDVYSMTWDFD